MSNEVTAREVQEIVADNLAIVMAKHNYQIKDIQKLTDYNMSAQQLNNVLKCQSFVSAKSIALLCNAFGCTPADLFTAHNRPKPTTVQLELPL